MTPFFMFDKFLSYLKFEKRYSAHTINAYQRDLNDFLEYAEIEKVGDFENLSASYIRSWIVFLIEKGLKNRSVNRKLASLRSFYKWLMKEEIVYSSPMSKVNGPKSEKHLPQFVQESELDLSKLEKLFSNDFEGKRDALMFELFYQTGIRLSELIGLRLEDLQPANIKVLGKRNKERIIPISNKLYIQAQEYLTLRQEQGPDSAHLLILDSGKKLYPAFAYLKLELSVLYCVSLIL